MVRSVESAVVDRRCFIEFERRFSPKLTLARFIPETTYGQQETLNFTTKQVKNDQILDAWYF